MRKSFEKDPCVGIFYDLNNQDPYSYSSQIGPVIGGSHKYMNSAQSNATYESQFNQNIKQVIKAPEMTKPKMEY